MEWLWAEYGLAIGYGLSIAWQKAVYGLAMGWLWTISAGHGLTMGRLSMDLLWPGYGLAISWLSTGYGLAIGPPPFDTMSIVFKY